MARATTWSALVFGAVLSGATLLAACGSSNHGAGFVDAGAGGVESGVLGSPVVDSGSMLGAVSEGGCNAAPPPSRQASPAACTACAMAGGKCDSVSGVCTIAENPGAVSAQEQIALRSCGAADPSFAWLYPYDRTVFPRGILPPTMQFAGNAFDATYVHVSFAELDYKGFFGPSNPGQVVLSPAVWEAITTAATSTDTVRIDITKISNGQVSGPVTENWTIAQGSLRGTIYYETYGSQIAGGLGSVGIMQIQPGAKAPTVVKQGCGNVCHTASADGSTLVANTAFPSGSASYDLKANVATMAAEGDDRFTYAALYPDGSFAMSATNYRTYLGGPSALFDAKTGASIPAPGWDGVVKSGGTVAFSPDGKYFAFNHEDTGAGHTLGLMDFDLPTHGFSNLTDIAKDLQNTLAWPAFTPDSGWIVYHAGSNAQFETDEGAKGDLFMVERTTKLVHRLSALDGYVGTTQQSYLPEHDTNLNFAPTVLPEAVGGYFWVVFTSHRSYGNMLASMEAGPDGPDEQGKLWVAALDLPASGEIPTPVVDPSHPAFYLDGQEATADNLRGFWVLPACQQDGATCGSGDACCGGYCRAVDDAGTLGCSSTSGGCAKDYEKCSVASDCCNAGDFCINGFCAPPGPQ